jgi:metacaspase-1
MATTKKSKAATKEKKASAKKATPQQLASSIVLNPSLLGGIFKLPKRKGYSLHIGLNSVNPAHYSGWSGPLKACEADANDMEHIAQSQGYTKITKLLTAQGTRAGVINTLNSYATKLVAGDILFISYSGHGGQIPDYSGEEADNMDETWCLYDGQLTDDELKIQWNKFAKGVRIFVLSDSCHSGTVTRDALVRDSINGKLGTARAMPSEVALKTYRDNKLTYDKIQAAVAASGIQYVMLNDVQPNVRLISGCQDNQLSYDGTFNGLFTSNLLKAWNNGAFVGNYTQFYNKIMTFMPSYQSPNHYVIGNTVNGFGQEKPFAI